MKYVSIRDLSSLATVSVEQAARVIGISRTAAYAAVKRGEIPVCRFGKRYRVLAQPLLEMLVGTSSHQGPSAPECVMGATLAATSTQSDETTP